MAKVCAAPFVLHMFCMFMHVLFTLFALFDLVLHCSDFSAHLFVMYMSDVLFYLN